MVVFNDDGEGLTYVAAASFYTLSKTCKAPRRIVIAINSVICVEKLAYSRRIVTLWVKQDEDVLGLPVRLELGHQLNKGQSVDYGRFIVKWCGKYETLTTVSVLRAQIRVNVVGSSKAN